VIIGAGKIPVPSRSPQCARRRLTIGVMRDNSGRNSGEDCARDIGRCMLDGRINPIII
jgi:hypothetical protein